MQQFKILIYITAASYADTNLLASIVAHYLLGSIGNIVTLFELMAARVKKRIYPANVKI